MTYLVYKIDTDIIEDRKQETYKGEFDTMQEVIDYIGATYSRTNFIRHLKTFNNCYKGYEVIRINY